MNLSQPSAAAFPSASTRPTSVPQTLGAVDTDTLAHLLATQGLGLDLGAAVVRVHAEVAGFAGDLQRVYRHFPLTPAPRWADVHVRLEAPEGLRGGLRPQVVLTADGLRHFEPSPADQALPLLEWGCNYLLADRLNDRLLLHAGVVERDGFALVMPAMPGSGKSTLTAALTQRGWRLLSDEFGVYDLEADGFLAMLKPPALKNQSIEVIGRLGPAVEMGRTFHKTRKGDVAHLAPSADAVARRHQLARPAAVLLPRWEADSPTRWGEAPENVLFGALALNAFNYPTLGDQAFRAAASLMRGCVCWHLTYSRLDEVLEALEARWPQVVAERSRHPASGEAFQAVRARPAEPTPESVRAPAHACEAAAAPAEADFKPPAAELVWLQALRDPARMRLWDLSTWQRVVRVARRHKLLARLAEEAAAHGLLADLPPAVNRLLQAERRKAEWRQRSVSWAIHRVGVMLEDLPGATAAPKVLLKGAAYMAQELPIAAGRMPSDLDVLVPRTQLRAIVDHLKVHGWVSQAKDAYTERYYFEFGHEAPPMHHPFHGMELDLHHTIVPPRRHMTIPGEVLLARARPSGWEGWRVLDPVDQVLHSATHLFMDAEPAGRLRDLVDLDGLLRQFVLSSHDFWDELQARAGDLGVQRPLALGLQMTREWLGTPVPDAVFRRALRASPQPGHDALLALLREVLFPHDPDLSEASSRRRAKRLLWLRFHLHRLPWRQALPHLWQKLKRDPAGLDAALG